MSQPSCQSWSKTECGTCESDSESAHGMKAKVKVIVKEKCEWLCTENEGENDYALKVKVKVIIFGKVKVK